jgi:hypothetical protein
MTPQFINDEHNQPMLVVLTIADYEEMLEDLEDLQDIVNRKDEPTIPFEQVLKELDAAIAKGIADSEAGRGDDIETVRENFRKRLEL